MRKLLILTLMVIFSLSIISFADMMAPKSIDAVMAEIRQEQKLNSSDQIDPAKVSHKMLEELGDSVMEAMIGNSAMHDQMDNNLGGDGSSTLTAFHEKLGYNYLSGYPNGMMDLMTGGMMGGGALAGNRIGTVGNNRFGMMGSFGGGGMILGIFLFLVVVAVIIAFIVILSRNNKYRKMGTYVETPLEILNRRFASGELSKEDYDNMKRNLNT